MESLKYKFLIFFTFVTYSLACAQSVTAQEPDEKPESTLAHSFSFVYIAQGNAEEMPVSEMEKKLENMKMNIY